MNVDLEIVSRSKLDVLEGAVAKVAHALYCGPMRRGVFLLALECNTYPKDADSAIIHLCSAIEGLGKAERRLWDKAMSRRFDIGCRLLQRADMEQVVLNEETLKRIVGIGATVAFTCYRDNDSEQVAHANAGCVNG